MRILTFYVAACRFLIIGVKLALYLQQNNYILCEYFNVIKT